MRRSGRRGGDGRRRRRGVYMTPQGGLSAGVWPASTYLKRFLGVKKGKKVRLLARVAAETRHKEPSE